MKNKGIEKASPNFIYLKNHMNLSAKQVGDNYFN